MLTRVSRLAAPTGVNHGAGHERRRHMRFVCSKCLRLWDAHRVAHRATCPFCGGALSDH
jgi:rRNA maturation endonuclease Nob1